jgi:hypothetical protein
MKDRVAAKPNRYAVYDDNHNFLRYEYHERADEPTQEGTPLNKGTLLSDETAAALGLTGDPTVDDGLAGIAAELAKGAWAKLKTVAVNITGTTTAAGINLINAGDIDFNNVDEILIEIRDMVTNTVVTAAYAEAYVRLDGTDICVVVSPTATGTKTFAFPYVGLITKNSGKWYTGSEDKLSLSIAGEVKDVNVTSACKNAKDIRLFCFCRNSYASSIHVTGTANIYTRKLV